jgi:hypothetical protein
MFLAKLSSQALDIMLRSRVVGLDLSVKKLQSIPQGGWQAVWFGARDRATSGSVLGKSQRATWWDILAQHQGVQENAPYTSQSNSLLV